MPLTLRPKPWGALGILTAGSVFVAIGILMVKNGESMGWLCVGFFGLCLPVGIIQLLPGSASLLLDDDGLTITSLYRQSKIAWTDIDRFFVVTMSQGGLPIRKMVGFNYSRGFSRAKLARRVATTLADCEGALPDNYGQKPEELATLLNKWLSKSSAALDARR